MAYSDALTGFNAGAARVGVTGAVRRAPLGTATPVLAADHKYSDVFKNMGYLSPDGVEISFDEDKSEFIPWQELNAIREDITKSVKKIKITLWEFTRGNAEVYFGLAKGSVKENPDTGVWSFYEDAIPNFQREQYSIDVVDGDAAMRLVVFEAQVSSRESIAIKRDEMIGLTIELSVYPAGESYEGKESRGKSTFWQFTDSWGGGNVRSTTDGSSTLAVATDALPDAAVGAAYSAQLAATGGTAPYRWAIDAGTLPAGLTLSEAGVVSGTPTAEALEDVTFRVTDKDSLIASKQIELEVTA
ncbi:Ig domain-containing protein [Corynebacterium doosanense]|uniref:Major tail protein n=1 Tax=Corynebacterium doosanense CAU 212 = DSM 45436 TaxID=558173 RepID=A0A097IJ60_9CORY|nr:Ig domain-containing protein [Corynebacterium doosanense]AIT62182.1 hypothetical protein CDOO_01965 [Corynebacterium doosanense CAU 212 = DSM 45436]